MKKIVIHIISIFSLFACYQPPAFIETELENAEELKGLFLSVSDKVQNVLSTLPNLLSQSLENINVDQFLNDQNIQGSLGEILNINNTAKESYKYSQDMLQKFKDNNATPDTITKGELVAKNSQALLEKTQLTENSVKRIKKLILKKKNQSNASLVKQAAAKAAAKEKRKKKGLAKPIGNEAAASPGPRATGSSVKPSFKEELKVEFEIVQKRLAEVATQAQKNTELLSSNYMIKG